MDNPDDDYESSDHRTIRLQRAEITRLRAALREAEAWMVRVVAQFDNGNDARTLLAKIQEALK